MRYFAIIDGEQRGPYTLDELEQAGVSPDTYVWCKAMSDWQQAKEGGEICRYFRQTLHSRSHTQQNVPAVVEKPEEAEDQYKDIPLRWRNFVMRSGEHAEMEPEPETDTSVPPFSWIVPAIGVMLLCFPITGAIALYYGIQSRLKWNGGLKAEAHASARKAKLWVLISIVAGCFLSAIIIKLRGV